MSDSAPTTETSDRLPAGHPRVLEVAPSEVAADEPTMARLVGLVGLTLSVLGLAAVIANQYGPRLIGSGLGYLSLAVGQAAMLYHAMRDGERDIRRGYTYFAYVLLIIFAIAALSAVFVRDGGSLASQLRKWPIPIVAGSAWSALPGLLGLGFLLATLRNETDIRFRNYALSIMLGVGGVLAVGSVGVGIFKPDTLVGPGVVMSLLGLAFLSGVLSQLDTSDGPGYLVAMLIGVLGATAVVYAVGRASAPIILFEGPNALKDVYQTYDKWKVGARVLLILASLALPVWALRSKNMPGWIRGAIAALGIGYAGVLVVGSIASNLILVPPQPYLVPSGLLLAGIGLIYLAISLGIISDNPLVTLIRRELASYFYSPIAYIVLIGMTIVAGVGYGIFLNSLFVRGGTQTEPILQNYWGATLGAAFSVLFLVPAITMRSLSEEKRSGTLEVLLTAPISETEIVLSKFFGAWLFYMFTWLPLGLFLIGLRVEGGEPFDYRPLLSYYLALAVCGAGFVAMGIFFSGLTRNQIIAAVLTFAGLFFMLLTIILQQFEKVGPSVQAVLKQLDFYSLWLTTLNGQLPLTNVFVHLSLAMFWLFMAIKILEARKWT